MKRILLSTAVLIALASPALAWTAQTGGSGPQAIGQDGGSATAQAQRQGQHQGQRQTATGGNATGGTSHATGGTSNVSISGFSNGGGNSSGGGGRAPDVYVPSIGGGGSDCPVVGIGAGGSGIGGGGGIGPSWISGDCNKRKVADLLAHLYGPEVARAYAEQNIDGVKEAVGTTDRPAYKYPAWCVESKGRWLRDLRECGEDPR